MGAKKFTDEHSVAAIGLSCRFPGEGANPEAFWRSICAGQSAWSKVPKERFDVDSFWSPTKRLNTSTTQGAHFLKDDISKFDANFFGLPKIEAEAIDPQHRSMIEVAYEALERAGLPLEKIAGTKTSVYMGHFTSDYKDMLHRDPDSAPMYGASGATSTSLAGRISWLWDLRGPCFTLDTACSSSLVALHQACLSLRTGESDMAIVGGVNLLLSPGMFMSFTNQGFLSPDGKSKAFDISANGYGRGEGFGCVVLKRVDDALNDGDRIRAVIRGSGVNHDGHTKGLTLPNGGAQAALIKEVYGKAGLQLSDTSYVEAHGTGTQAGDLAEMQALGETIGSARSSRNKLTVGSVKTNIGHLEAAAGIAAVIKSIMILENGIIPPNLHFNIPNPKIDFEAWNLHVPTQLTPWPRKDLRRISINSFGYAGTNAHAILDDVDSYLRERGLVDANRLSQPVSHVRARSGKVNAIPREAALRNKSWRQRLYVLSAQDKDGLQRVHGPLAKYVSDRAQEPETTNEEQVDFLAKLAFTLSERRTRLKWRTFALGSSADEIVQVLQSKDSVAPVSQASRSPRLGFVFTGQGAQWARMGMELMEFPIFKDAVQASDSYLRDVSSCEWSTEDELNKSKATSQLHLAEFSQTLCAVLQIALVDLLRSWGIHPTAVVGHSSGEIGAAYAFGALSREDAWRVAYYRGVLSAGLKDIAAEIDGSMMAVGLSAKKAGEWLGKVTNGDVVIACINSPTSVTLSGDTTAIDQLLQLLKQDGIFARKLLVDTAYHSPHMQAIAQEYYEWICDLEPAEPTDGCTMHSSVTGSIITSDQLGVVNWVRNLTSPVRFSDAVHDMLRPAKDGKRSEENAVDILIEIGPHTALQGPVMQTLSAHNILNIPYYSAVVREKHAIDTALTLAGTLWSRGYDVHVQEINAYGTYHAMKPLVDLPTYPWKHSQRYYHDVRLEKEYLFRNRPNLSLIGAPTPSLAQREHSWRRIIRLSEEPWIADHKVQGTILYPAAGYLAMALEAASQMVDPTKRVAGYRLQEIQFSAAAIISEGQDLECIIQLRPHVIGTRDLSSTWTEFRITSSPDGQSLVTNCNGLLLVEYEQPPGSGAERERELYDEAIVAQYQKAKILCRNHVDTAEMYKSLETIGLEYGPAFSNVRQAYNSSGQSFGGVEIPDLQSRVMNGCERPHIIHPGTLDAVFHLAFAALMNNTILTAMVPKFIAEVTVSTDIPWLPGSNLPGFAQSQRHGLRDVTAGVIMLDHLENSPLVNIQGLELTEVVGSSSNNTSPGASRSIASKLMWRPAIDLLTSTQLLAQLEPFRGTETLVEYLQLLHHAHPSFSILEITNGQPYLTTPELAGVKATADVTIACTDSAMLAHVAELALGTSVTSIDFSQPISIETLEHQGYDVIIIADLASYGQRMELVLSRIKAVLAPGGRLCILADKPAIAFFETNNCVQLKDRTILRGEEQGFVIVRESISSNGVDRNGTHPGELVKIVVPVTITDHIQEVVDGLVTILESHGQEVELIDFNGDVSALAGTSCISLLELQEPVLEGVGPTNFSFIQHMILESASLMWITGSSVPSSRIVDGLARVVRNETPGLKFRTLHMGHVAMLPADLALLISGTLFSKLEDDEYIVKDDIIHIGRIQEDQVINIQLDRLLPGAAKGITNMALKEAPGPLKLTVQSPGMLDSFCMELDEAAGVSLDPACVEVAVQVSSINFRDLMTAMGQIPDPTLGADAAGVVRRIGPGVTELKIGDRVAFLVPGSHSTHPHVRADNCVLIPDGMSYEEAASVPTIHGTAWYALVKLARVEPGQSLLVHAAAGGVGQAAIQVAKHFGMEIFATVSTELKRKLIRDSYGIPDDHIFNSRDLSFVKGIKRMTHGRGVDVILNSLSGEMLRLTWHCIAPFGYFIEIGLRDILNNTGLDMAPFKQDATFTFLNLAHIQKSRPKLLAVILKGTFDFFRQGVSTPVNPITAYPISDVERAFRLMQAGKHLGKLVLTWGENDIVPVLDSHKKKINLNPDGAYVLVGGLGGLGRSLAEQLVELGARKLCFLSRSGAKSPAAKDLVLNLRKEGVQVEVLTCDISSESAVASALGACSEKLGAIRGIVQGAMVLRDTLFVNMTHQQWIEATHCKIQGSWNLHKHLPDVDFFIILSSAVATFGNRGQSNYAAGGSYQDELAYHRRSLGMSAVVVDLGIMRDIGVLAETGMTDNLKDWEEPYGIRKAEFHALMELAIGGSVVGGVAPPQIITGLATGGSAVLAGITRPYYLDNAIFSIMSRNGMHEANGLAGADPDAASAPTYTYIAQADSIETASMTVTAALVRQIARMVQMPADEVDTGRFLHNYGIDSLLAIEVVNWALKDAKSTINVFDVLSSIPMTALAAKIASKSTALRTTLDA